MWLQTAPEYPVTVSVATWKPELWNGRFYLKHGAWFLGQLWGHCAVAIYSQCPLIWRSICESLEEAPGTSDAALTLNISYWLLRGDTALCPGPREQRLVRPCNLYSLQGEQHQQRQKRLVSVSCVPVLRTGQVYTAPGEGEDEYQRAGWQRPNMRRGR